VCTRLFEPCFRCHHAAGARRTFPTRIRFARARAPRCRSARCGVSGNDGKRGTSVRTTARVDAGHRACRTQTPRHLVAWHWARGTGHVALGAWHWARGTGDVALETWHWRRGTGDVALDITWRGSPLLGQPMHAYTREHAYTCACVIEHSRLAGRPAWPGLARVAHSPWYLLSDPLAFMPRFCPPV